MTAENGPDPAPGIVSMMANDSSGAEQASPAEGANNCYESCDSSGCDCFDSGDCFDACDTAPGRQPAGK